MQVSDVRKKVYLTFFGLAIIIILVLSAYSNTLNSPPILDDTHSFIDEPLIQNFNWSAPAVKALSRSKFGWARFIPMLTLGNDYWRGQGSLRPFHLTNIFIHLLTTLAVFFWSRLLFRLLRNQQEDKESVNELLASLAVAGIWALVPIQTNAVTYIVQRMASLVTLFYILSFTMYFHGRLNWLSNGKKKALSFWFMAFICFVLALMSKENAVTLPVMIIIAEELFFRCQFHAWLSEYKKIIIATIILFMVVVLAVSVKMVPSILSGYDKRHFTLDERLLTELRVVSSYISLLLFPWPSRLCLDHHVALSTSLLTPFTTLLSFCFLLFLAGLAWCWRHRYPLLTFGLAWFFCNLILESSFIPLELKFEHRLYLPSCGFYLFLVGAGIVCGRHFSIPIDQRIWGAALLILLAVLSLMTHMRNLVWIDAVTLYGDCAKKAFLKPRVHSNLSKAYSVAGFQEKAIAEAEKAIELGVNGYEEYWVAACNMITAYKRQGREKEALSKGEELLADAPENAKINAKPIFLRNLAVLYKDNGKYWKAYQSLYSAIELLSRSTLPYLSALEQDMLMLLDEARDNCDTVTLEQLGLPDHKKSSVLMVLAKMFFELGDFSRAHEYACQANKVDANCEVCRNFIVKLENIEKLNARQHLYGTFKDNYLKHFWQSSFNLKMAVAYIVEKYHFPLGRLAEYLVQQARQLKPDSPDPWLLDSWLYYCGRKYDKAIAMVRKGLQLDENYSQLWVNLGMYQLAAEQPRQALISLQKALELYPGYPRRQEVAAMIAAAREKMP